MSSAPLLLLNEFHTSGPFLCLLSKPQDRRGGGGGYLRMIDTFRNYTRKQKIVLDTTGRKVETVHVSVPFFTRSSPPGVEV